ncbi:hypothetical protein [Streptomyces sp. NPDC002082]|uniref:hypothetical protein n=1 Tax=Streptomyces sp. NPDC002082 TaxID=3154772 RepID=UPI0033317918
MASAIDWQLRHGSARVFQAGGELARPVVLAAGEVGPTDLDAFAASVDHTSYSFLAELKARGRDLVLVGYGEKTATLAEQANVVQEAISRTISQKAGNSGLVVGGVGRGALAARYALAKAEQQAMENETALYFSYNGTAPSSAEGEELQGLGGWPQRPRLVKLVSADFTSALDDEDFHDTKAGAANAGGPLFTKELGSWLLDQIEPVR